MCPECQCMRIAEVVRPQVALETRISMQSSYEGGGGGGSSRDVKNDHPGQHRQTIATLIKLIICLAKCRT